MAKSYADAGHFARRDRRNRANRPAPHLLLLGSREPSQ